MTQKEKANRNILLKNCNINWVKLDPNNPVPTYDEDGFEWTLEMRTNDEKQKAEWEAAHIKVKEKHDKETKEFLYYVAYLRKLAYKEEELEDGASIKDVIRKAPSCVDLSLTPLDPTIVGNGSMANIHVKEREWTWKKKAGISADLKGIQVSVLKPYHGDASVFEELGETKILESEDQLEEDDIPFEGGAADPELDDDSAY